MLAEEIRATTLQPGELALWFLAQAGICLKSSDGLILYVDAYLSNCCDRMFQFPRQIPPPIAAEDVRTDYWISTHAHADHLDIDTVPVIARDPRVRFIGARDCAEVYQQLGIPQERYHVLRVGEQYRADGFSLQAIYADHGELAPEAVGMLIEIDGIRVYHTGDTALRIDDILATLPMPIDIMLLPINSAFGNLDAQEAVMLVRAVSPRIAIGCHVGMFAAHLGDPSAFLSLAGNLPNEISVRLMAPGALLRYRRE